MFETQDKKNFSKINLWGNKTKQKEKKKHLSSLVSHIPEKIKGERRCISAAGGECMKYKTQRTDQMEIRCSDQDEAGEMFVFELRAISYRGEGSAVI